MCANVLCIFRIKNAHRRKIMIYDYLLLLLYKLKKYISCLLSCDTQAGGLLFNIHSHVLIDYLIVFKCNRVTDVTELSRTFNKFL